MAKQSFFEAVYGKRLNGPFGDYLIQSFPLLSETIHSLKTENPLSGHKKIQRVQYANGKYYNRYVDGAYAFLAQQMQRQESAFMFQQVVPRIHSELGIRLLTKHDSVLVADEHVDFVKQIFHEEFAKQGMEANLKIEHHGEPERLGSV